MTTYSITLSDAENKALGVVAVSQDDWIQNAVHERCRVAMEEIIAIEVQRLLSEGKPISGSKDDIVMNSPVKSLAERQAELKASETVETPTE